MFFSGGTGLIHLRARTTLSSARHSVALHWLALLYSFFTYTLRNSLLLWLLQNGLHGCMAAFNYLASIALVE